MIQKIKKDETAKTLDLDIEIKRLNFSIEAENNFNRIVFINTSFTTSGLFDLDGQVASWMLEYGATAKKKAITDTLPPKFQELARTIAQQDKCNLELEVAAKNVTAESSLTEIVPVSSDPVLNSALLPNDFFDEF